MDPNATLADIQRYVLDDFDMEAMWTSCQMLKQWLMKDGFQPDWKKYPYGSVTYRVWDYTIQHHLWA